MPSTGWPSITEKSVARAYWLGRTGYLEAAALQHALVEREKEGRDPGDVPVPRAPARDHARAGVARGTRAGAGRGA